MHLIYKTNTTGYKARDDGPNKILVWQYPILINFLDDLHRSSRKKSTNFRLELHHTSNKFNRHL